MGLPIAPISQRGGYQRPMVDHERAERWGVQASYDAASGQRREAPDASVDHVIAALDRGEGRDGPPEGDRPLFLPVGTTALPPHLAGRSLVLEDGTDLGPVQELPPDLTPGLH